MSFMSLCHSHMRAFMPWTNKKDTVDAEQKMTFLLTRCGLAAMAAFVFPLHLAWGGIPDAGTLGIYASLLSTLISVGILALSRSLPLAYTFSALSLLAGALAFVFTHIPFSILPLYAFILFSCFEIILFFQISMVRMIICASLFLILMTLGLGGYFGIWLTVSTTYPLLLITLACLLYAGLLAASTLRFYTLRQHLHHSRDRAYEILQDLTDGLTVQCDPEGSVIQVGDMYSRSLPLCPSDLLGRGLFERLHIADRPLFLKTIDQTLHQDAASHLVIRVSLGTAYDPSPIGSSPHFSSLHIHMRRQKLPTGVYAVDMLLQPMPEMTQKETMPTPTPSFSTLAAFGQELSTSLHTILHFSDLLRHQDSGVFPSPAICEQADRIHASGRHLLILVETMLDLSRLETGAFEFHPEVLDVEHLLQNCCNTLRLRAEEAEIDLSYSLAEHVTSWTADQQACTHIIIHLLANALASTPAGGQVHVHAKLEGNSLVFCVVDTGIGIPREALPYLGQAFFRARPSQGVGLGLALVRGLVGLHEGRLFIESSEGCGTHVRVQLPLEARESTNRAGFLVKIEVSPWVRSPMASYMARKTFPSSPACRESSIRPIVPILDKVQKIA